MMIEDYIMVAIIVTCIDLFFMFITINFCSYLVDKRIANQEEIKEERARKERKKKIRKNLEKSKAAKKEPFLKRIGTIVFGEDDDIFDDIDDEETTYTRPKLLRKKAEYKEPKQIRNLGDITDEEIDQILKEAREELEKEEAEDDDFDIPEFSDKVVSMSKGSKIFNEPQELVDYAAKKYKDGRIDVYDKKHNVIRQIQSFKTNARGDLYIFYKNYSVPDKFEPGRFSRVA